MSSRKARRSSILKSRNSVGPGGDGGSEEIYSEGADGGTNSIKNMDALLRSKRRSRVSFSEKQQIKEFEKVTSFGSDGSNSASSINVDMMNQTALDLDMSVYYLEEIENQNQSKGDYTRVDHIDMSIVDGHTTHTSLETQREEQMLANPAEMSCAKPRMTTKINRSKKIDCTMVDPKDMSVYQSSEPRMTTKTHRSKKIDCTMVNPRDMSVYQSSEEAGQNSRSNGGNQTALNLDMSVYPFEEEEIENRNQSKGDYTRVNHIDMSIVDRHTTHTSLSVETQNLREEQILANPAEMSCPKPRMITKKHRSKKIECTMLNPRDMSVYQSSEEPGQKSRSNGGNQTALNLDMSVYPFEEEEIENRNQSKGDYTRVNHIDMSIVEGQTTHTSLSVKTQREEQMSCAKPRMTTKKHRSKKIDCTMVDPRDMSVYQSSEELGQKSRSNGGNQTALNLDMSVYPFEEEEIENRNQSKADYTRANHIDMSIVDRHTTHTSLSVETQRGDYEEQMSCSKPRMTNKINRSKKIDCTTVDPKDMSVYQSSEPRMTTKINRSKKIDCTMVDPKDMSVYQSSEKPGQNSRSNGGNHTALNLSVYQGNNEENEESPICTRQQMVTVHNNGMTAAALARPVLFFTKPDPQFFRNPFGYGKSSTKTMNTKSSQDSSGKNLSFGVFGNPKSPRKYGIKVAANIPRAAKTPAEKVLTVNELVQTSPALLMNPPKATMCNISINCTIANHLDDESKGSIVDERGSEGDEKEECNVEVVNVDVDGDDAVEKESDCEVAEIEEGGETDADEYDGGVANENQVADAQDDENDEQELINKDGIAGMETARSSMASRNPEDLEEPGCMSVSTVENKFYFTMTVGDVTGVVIDDDQDEDESELEGDNEEDLSEFEEDGFENDDPAVKVNKTEKKVESAAAKESFYQDDQQEAWEVFEELQEDSISEAVVKFKAPEPKMEPRKICSSSSVNVINSKIQSFILKNDPIKSLTSYHPSRMI